MPTLVVAIGGNSLIRDPRHVTEAEQYRSELARHEVHEVPFDVAVAETQGSIGYELVHNLERAFRRRGIERRAVAVVTQAEAARRRDEEGRVVREDAGRGWRRVVPSPRPLRIVEEAAVRALVEAGFVVVTVGGGGIRVVPDPAGGRRGVAAVRWRERWSPKRPPSRPSRPLEPLPASAWRPAPRAQPPSRSS